MLRRVAAAGSSRAVLSRYQLGICRLPRTALSRQTSGAERSRSLSSVYSSRTLSTTAVCRNSSDSERKKMGTSAQFLGMPLVNTLETARSPYLRAHANNPVAWQQWTPATLARAVAENKPIFLSIGYHTCHWCHVMNREAFSSEKIAAKLNEYFIPIKLDREERPDLDAIYMLYLQAMSGGRGGWPLNVFLAPGSLEPIYGGTYWPGPWDEVSAKTGRTTKPPGPEFLEVLERIHELWAEDEAKCRFAGTDIVRQLRDWTAARSKGDSTTELHAGVLFDAYEYFTERFDEVNGGFGEAPKFPQPTMMSLLIKMHPHMRVKEKIDMGDDRNAADMAIYTLKKIAGGGIKDQVGHGFSRYSVTADWQLPHFEKMLYDQSLLLTAYLDAWLYDKKKNQFALDCVRDIAEYLVSGSLRNEAGGYYSAEDADSVAPDNTLMKREGAFYVWSYDEFFKVLGRIPGDIAAAYWGVSEYGNVDSQYDLHGELEGLNVLSVTMDVPELSGVFGMTEEKVREVIEDCKKKLRAYREEQRRAPEVDVKIVACWNGLAMGALARAGAAVMEIDQVSRTKWLESAKKTARFLKEKMFDAESGRLWRVFCDGERGSTLGMCEDYAYVISGLLDLYEATFDVSYLRWARELQETQNALFWDSEDNGFFSALAEDEGARELILRMKSGADTVEPSSNAVSVANLMRLAAVFGEDEYEQMALRTLDAYAKEIVAQPQSYCGMLGSVVAGSEGLRTVVIVGQTREEMKETVEKMRSVLAANTIVVGLRKEFGEGAEEEEARRAQEWLVAEGDEIYAGLLSRSGSRNGTTSYICQERRCSAPIEDSEELVRALSDEVGSSRESDV
ncbi:hypothetical protein BZA70DRAFT_282912 [Myxozyma melibiosi]|uniref:Spermatogenesis-associated protein 20-like TRX domain-containing protein n=1 Tax=Myxozyma melibiosi TaxID=54550 RepID=A0ABR1F1A3_9ASCO